MAFVITSRCCNDASCVDACPVDCIRPHPDDPEYLTAEQLYIDPESCIGCSACAYACPVAAIHDQLELPPDLSQFASVNADYFATNPLTPRFLDITSGSQPAPVPARVAVIGTGPAGCYAIAELSAVPGVEISVYERLPTPFGLIRSGVAPDHQDTKLVSDYFGSLLEHPRVTCNFNVDIGTHLTIDEVRAAHHAVIYAGGAADDRTLGIVGETLNGSASAREFVSWYNGSPHSADRTFDLSGNTAVVLGNGNVALDVARALARPAERFASTDMADHALDALRSSRIRDIVVVGRRGPADAACTFPELLELSQLQGVEVRVSPADLHIDAGRAMTQDQTRKFELFRRLASDTRPHSDTGRRITFRFGLEPVEISGTTAVTAVVLRPTGRPETTPEVISAGLALRAIGYAVTAVPGLPFDQAARTLSHRQGRCVDPTNGAVMPGLYCVGWAKRGPSGVIGTNRVCSRETTDAVLNDLRRGLLPEPTSTLQALEELHMPRQSRRVDLSGWHAIDTEERRAGRASDPVRPRRKFVDVARMLTVIDLARVSTSRPATINPKD